MDWQEADVGVGVITGPAWCDNEDCGYSEESPWTYDWQDSPRVPKNLVPTEAAWMDAMNAIPEASFAGSLPETYEPSFPQPASTWRDAAADMLRVGTDEHNRDVEVLKLLWAESNNAYWRLVGFDQAFGRYLLAMQDLHRATMDHLATEGALPMSMRTMGMQLEDFGRLRTRYFSELVEAVERASAAKRHLKSATESDQIPYLHQIPHDDDRPLF